MVDSRHPGNAPGAHLSSARAGRAASGLVAATFVLLAAACGPGGAPELPTLRGRPAWHGFARHRNATVTEISVGQETRLGLDLRGKPWSIEFDWPDRGRLEIGLARLDQRGGPAGVTVSLARDGAETQPVSCGRHFDGAPSRSWQTCVLELPPGGGSVRLVVGAVAPAGARLVMSEPIVEAADPADRLPAVVLIVSDTTRADALGAYPPAIAGAMLRKLAPESVVFDQARTVSSWTRPAVASLLTGLRPGTHKVLDELDHLPSEIDTLATRLKEAGWITLGVSTNPHILPTWGFGRGFDFFLDVGAEEWATRKADGRAVAGAIERAVGPSGAAGRFVYLHLMDAHGPYLPAQPHLALLDRRTGGVPRLPAASLAAGGLSANTRATVAAQWRRYLAEVVDADLTIGRIVQGLRRTGQLDRALVVVTADHGEEFLDHGGQRHGHTLYEELLRIPLLLKLPGNRFGGTRVAAAVGLADVAPTLLDALGLAPTGPVDGRDLLPLAEATAREAATNVRDEGPASAPLPAAAEGDGSALVRLKYQHRNQAALIEGHWKLITNVATGRNELYDLEADPHETRDLSDHDGERVHAMRARLDAALAHDEHGWHLLACGGTSGAALELIVEDPPAEAQTILNLEDSDRARRHAGSGVHRLELLLDLSPADVLRAIGPEGASRIVPLPLPDRDEVILATTIPTKNRPPVTSRIRAAVGSLRFAVGTSDKITNAPAVDLGELGSEATLPPGAAPTCLLGVGLASRHPAQPYLRIYRIEPGQKSTAPLDPALRTRLEALGYLEP